MPLNKETNQPTNQTTNHQLCVDTGCPLEELLRVMIDRGE